MLVRSRGATRDGSLSDTQRQHRKVGNLVWPIKSRQTNTHYSFIGIYELTKVGSDQRSSTASMHSASESMRARACRTTSKGKYRCADAFQKQNRTRAHTVVYVTAEIFIRNCRDFQKKGKRKSTCHFPSSVYSLPSLGMFTFRIVLNRILHKSSLLAPVESRRTRRPTFTAEERLERDRRRHAERRARERREQTQARRDVDRLRSSQARASETVEETAARRDVDRLQSSQARASETVEETAANRDVERLRSSQAHAAKTVEETAARTEVQRL